jgi:hypothetical protein
MEQEAQNTDEQKISNLLAQLQEEKQENQRLKKDNQSKGEEIISLKTEKEAMIKAIDEFSSLVATLEEKMGVLEQQNQKLLEKTGSMVARIETLPKNKD